MLYFLNSAATASVTISDSDSPDFNDAFFSASPMLL